MVTRGVVVRPALASIVLSVSTEVVSCYAV